MVRVPNGYHHNGETWKPCFANVRKCPYTKIPHISVSQYAQQYPQRVLESGGKSNTSAAETAFIGAFIAYNDGDEQNFSTHIQTIHDLPQSQKFTIIREAGIDQLRDLVDNLHELTKYELGIEDLNLEAERNNRIGSDVEEKNTETSIELKFGAATDLNIGVKSFNTLLPDDVLAAFPSKKDKEHWKNLYQQGDKDDQFNQYLQKLQEVQNLMKERKYDLSDKAQHTLDAFYAGITSADEIEKLYNDPKLLSRKILRFHLKNDFTWEKFSRPEITTQKQWAFDKSELTSANRLNFFFTNANQYFVRFTYNHKNNFKFKDGTVVEAKRGLGSPSINGWFNKEK